jgi:hypothetical protein
MKVWLATQHFHCNEQIVDGVENWLHNWRHRSLTRGYKNQCHNTISAKMWMETVWTSNAVLYVTVPYNKVLFSILYFFYQLIGGWCWNSLHTLTWMVKYSIGWRRVQLSG